MSALLDLALADCGDDQRLADIKANDEAERIQADLLRNVNKGQKLAARNDAHALDLQVQYQGCIGWLPV